MEHALQTLGVGEDSDVEWSMHDAVVCFMYCWQEMHIWMHWRLPSIRGIVCTMIKAGQMAQEEVVCHLNPATWEPADPYYAPVPLIF